MQITKILKQAKYAKDHLSGGLYYDDGDKEIMEALIAAAELLKQVEWQPIESAPKKEWCLVSAPNIPCAKVYIAMFSEVNGCWWQDDLRTQVNSPTHWQPLPQPPVIIEKEGVTDTNVGKIDENELIIRTCKHCGIKYGSTPKKEISDPDCCFQC